MYCLNARLKNHENVRIAADLAIYILDYFSDYYGYGPGYSKLQTTFGFVFTCHVIGYHFESIVVDYYANESKV